MENVTSAMRSITQPRATWIRSFWWQPGSLQGCMPPIGFLWFSGTGPKSKPKSAASKPATARIPGCGLVWAFSVLHAVSAHVDKKCVSISDPMRTEEFCQRLPEALKPLLPPISETNTPAWQRARCGLLNPVGSVLVKSLPDIARNKVLQ
jgi:hypothetical protein